MNIKVLLPLAFVLLSCDPLLQPPQKEECTEFPYTTTRNGKPVTCQVLWCSRGEDGSGMAVLWCDEVPEKR